MTTSDAMYDEAVKLRDAGDLEGAVKKLKEIVESDPDYALAHSALGVNLHKLGQFDDAIRHASRVTEIAPNDHFSWMQLSVIFQRCGKIPEAEAAMARSHEVRMAQGK